MSVLLNTIRMCQVYWGVTFHYYWMNTFFTTTMHLPCPRNLSEINQQHFLKLYTKWWFPFRIKVSFFAVQFFDVSSGYLIPCGYTNNSVRVHIHLIFFVRWVVGGICVSFQSFFYCRTTDGLRVTTYHSTFFLCTSKFMRVHLCLYSKKIGREQWRTRGHK